MIFLKNETVAHDSYPILSHQTSQKKSKVPVQLDLGNMLAFLEQKQQSQKSKQDQRPVTLSGKKYKWIHYFFVLFFSGGVMHLKGLFTPKNLILS